MFTVGIKIIKVINSQMSSYMKSTIYGKLHLRGAVHLLCQMRCIDPPACWGRSSLPAVAGPQPPPCAVSRPRRWKCSSVARGTAQISCPDSGGPH